MYVVTLIPNKKGASEPLFLWGLGVCPHPRAEPEDASPTVPSGLIFAEITPNPRALRA